MKKLLLLLTFILSQGLIAAPIHDAARRGSPNRVQRLIDGGADVNSSDDCYWTPLHYAAASGSTDIVRLLLNSGARIDDVNSGWSRKLDSYTFRSEISFSLIMESSINIFGGNTALHIASEVGKIEVVELLISRGAEVNAIRFDGKTPLHMASYKKHPDVVRFLIESGADCMIKCKFGLTPDHLASYNSKELAEIIKNAPPIEARIGGLRLLSVRALNRLGVTRSIFANMPNHLKWYVYNIHEEGQQQKCCSIQ